MARHKKEDTAASEPGTAGYTITKGKDLYIIRLGEDVIATAVSEDEAKAYLDMIKPR